MMLCAYILVGPKYFECRRARKRDAWRAGDLVALRHDGPRAPAVAERVVLVGEIGVVPVVGRRLVVGVVAKVSHLEYDEPGKTADLVNF